MTRVPTLIATTEKWLVLAKPTGWLSIPGRGASEGVVSDWAATNHGDVWTVHRLDRDTSGVILFARTGVAHREACLWFQNHEVKKTYELLASGIPRAPMIRISRPIEGAPSTTQLEVRESYEQGFIGRARPLTGRRHQIRIHLAAEGHPLWGDPEYRGPSQVKLGEHETALGRVALHAARLELPGGEVFESPWPEDFQEWVTTLRKEGTRVF